MNDKYIPAKPTEYRGILFKSALEARFAEHLDHIGVTWVYEKSTGGRYLPDFFLPEYEVWVEIKPTGKAKEADLFKNDIIALRRLWIMVDMPERGYWKVIGSNDRQLIDFGAAFNKGCLDALKPQKVFYLAGKIGKYDWRHHIVSGLRNMGGPVVPGNAHELVETGVTLHAIAPGLHYSGPYFIACDHGCYHGEDTHGCLEQNGVECCSADPPPGRWQVSQISRRQIARSDIVFAWIDGLTAYGTLVEMGFAAAMGKEIWLGCPHKFDDLWFAASMASEIVYAPTAKGAFRYLLVKRGLIPPKAYDEFGEEVSEGDYEPHPRPLSDPQTAPDFEQMPAPDEITDTAKDPESVIDPASDSFVSIAHYCWLSVLLDKPFQPFNIVLKASGSHYYPRTHEDEEPSTCTIFDPRAVSILKRDDGYLIQLRCAEDAPHWDVFPSERIAGVVRHIKTKANGFEWYAWAPLF